jgi:hypothetical protein
MSFSIQSFRCTYNTIMYIHGAFPLAFPTPCWFPFAPLCVPFVFPSTYLAPSSCDRNRPPPSQVACKLTPFAPPFAQLTHPSQIPRTPPAPRLTMTTSGIFRLLLLGIVTKFIIIKCMQKMWRVKFVTLAEKFARTWQQWFTSNPLSLFM